MQNNYNIVKIKTQEGKYKPKDWDVVKVINQADRYLDEKATKHKILTHVRKIDKEHYINLKTGEIKKYKFKSPDEDRDYFVLMRTFEKLRQILRTNFVGDKSEAFLTLTYKQNMTDEKKLYADLTVFLRTVRRNYPEMKLEYVAVAEPQGRGAWHWHIVVKNMNGNFWINQAKLRKMWGHGGAYIERLKNGDIGAYYVTYFTSTLQGISHKKAHDKAENSTERLSKAKLKGSRIGFYPKHFKFYRCSRGIKRPTEEELFHFEISQDNGYEQVFERSIDVLKDVDIVESNGIIKTNTEELNMIYNSTYKRKEWKT